MKNKIASIVIALVCCFNAIILAGCGKNENDSENGSITKVWTALPSEVFVQDILPETYPEAKFDIAAMKGETESGQIMITAGEFIRGIDVEVTDLVGEGGEVISKDNVKIYGEHYVEIVSPYINSGSTNVTIASPSGFYPDALIPLKNFKAKREDRVEKGHNQGIWVDFEVPADAQAGLYSATVKLMLGEQKEVTEIPVSLKVYDLSMPVEVHSRSAFNIWYSQIASGEKSNYDSNTNQAYYDYLLSKRLCSPTVDPNKSANIDQLVEYMVEIALDPRVTIYNVKNFYIGIEYPTFLAARPPQAVGLSDSEIANRRQKAENSTYAGLKKVFTKVLAKNVEKIEEDPDVYGELNMFKKLTFYFYDEPPAGYPREMIRKFNEILTTVKRDFISENQETFERYPALLESLKYDVRDMTTVDNLHENLRISLKEDGTPDYEKGDGVTLWVQHCHIMNSEATMNLIKERQSLGEQVWWYTCVRNSPALSYYVESKTMNMRLQGWQQFEYNLDGILYWDCVQWGSLTDCNPYNSLDNVLYDYGAGEGCLLYPGYQYGLKTPVGSIRMENLFQAQEDYEYLYMLDAFITVYNAENGTDLDAHALVGAMIDDMQTYTFIKESATPEQLESCRIRVLNILEKFASGDSASAIDLIQNELQ